MPVKIETKLLEPPDEPVEKAGETRSARSRRGLDSNPDVQHSNHSSLGLFY